MHIHKCIMRVIIAYNYCVKYDYSEYTRYDCTTRTERLHFRADFLRVCRMTATIDSYENNFQED